MASVNCCTDPEAGILEIGTNAVDSDIEDLVCFHLRELCCLYAMSFQVYRLVGVTSHHSMQRFKRVLATLVESPPMSFDGFIRVLLILYGNFYYPMECILIVWCNIFCTVAIEAPFSKCCCPCFATR